MKFAVPLTEMNIDKMVHGCPWRHSPKIYLQVLFFFHFILSFSWLLMFFFSILSFCLLFDWWRLSTLLGENMYLLLQHLVWNYYLPLTWSLSFLLKISNFLHGWMECMLSYHSALIKGCVSTYHHVHSFFFSSIGAWQNIFPIWKNLLRNRSAA